MALPLYSSIAQWFIIILVAAAAHGVAAVPRRHAAPVASPAAAPKATKPVPALHQPPHAIKPLLEKEEATVKATSSSSSSSSAVAVIPPPISVYERAQAAWTLAEDVAKTALAPKKMRGIVADWTEHYSWLPWALTFLAVSAGVLLVKSMSSASIQAVLGSEVKVKGRAR